MAESPRVSPGNGAHPEPPSVPPPPLLPPPPEAPLDSPVRQLKGAAQASRPGAALLHGPGVGVRRGASAPNSRPASRPTSPGRRQKGVAKSARLSVEPASRGSSSSTCVARHALPASWRGRSDSHEWPGLQLSLQASPTLSSNASDSSEAPRPPTCPTRVHPEVEGLRAQLEASEAAYRRRSQQIAAARRQSRELRSENEYLAGQLASIRGHLPSIADTSVCETGEEMEMEVISDPEARDTTPNDKSAWQPALRGSASVPIMAPMEKISFPQESKITLDEKPVPQPILRGSSSVPAIGKRSGERRSSDRKAFVEQGIRALDRVMVRVAAWSGELEAQVASAKPALPGSCHVSATEAPKTWRTEPDPEAPLTVTSRVRGAGGPDNAGASVVALSHPHGSGCQEQRAFGSQGRGLQVYQEQGQCDAKGRSLQVTLWPATQGSEVHFSVKSVVLSPAAPVVTPSHRPQAALAPCPARVRASAQQGARAQASPPQSAAVSRLPAARCALAVPVPLLGSGG